MSFADALRRLREQAGLTQAGLAERSGIPIRTIQGWEQGQRCPVSPAFFTLVKALGVAGEAFAACDDIQGGEEAPSLPAANGKGKAPKAGQAEEQASVPPSAKKVAGGQGGAKKGKGKGN